MLRNAIYRRHVVSTRRDDRQYKTKNALWATIKDDNSSAVVGTRINECELGLHLAREHGSCSKSYDRPGLGP